MGVEYSEHRSPRASWEDPTKSHVGNSHQQLQALVAGTDHAAGKDMTWRDGVVWPQCPGWHRKVLCRAMEMCKDKGWLFC